LRLNASLISHHSGGVSGTIQKIVITWLSWGFGCHGADRPLGSGIEAG